MPHLAASILLITSVGNFKERLDVAVDDNGIGLPENRSGHG